MPLGARAAAHAGAPTRAAPKLARVPDSCVRLEPLDLGAFPLVCARPRPRSPGAVLRQLRAVAVQRSAWRSQAPAQPGIARARRVLPGLVVSSTAHARVLHTPSGNASVHLALLCTHRSLPLCPGPYSHRAVAVAVVMPLHARLQGAAAFRSGRLPFHFPVGAIGRLHPHGISPWWATLHGTPSHAHAHAPPLQPLHKCGAAAGARRARFQPIPLERDTCASPACAPYWPRAALALPGFQQRTPRPRLCGARFPVWVTLLAAAAGLFAQIAGPSGSAHVSQGCLLGVGLSTLAVGLLWSAALADDHRP